MTEELLGRLTSLSGPARREAEDELVRVNLVVAQDVSRRYRGRGVDADDLLQVACTGLVKAARGFDPDKGSHFLGYAVPTIRGELRRHFRDQGWVVRPPRAVQELQPRVAEARGTLWQRLGRDPSTGEIAQELELGIGPVSEAMAAEGCFTPSSLDFVTESPGPGPRAVGRDDPGFGRAEAAVVLGPVLRALTERERRILSMWFVDDCTQAEIGREIGVTQMQVSRLLSGLLDRMRSHLAGTTEPISA